MAELLVDSNVCLAEGHDVLKLAGPGNRFDVEIKNNPGADPFARNSLRVEMNYEVESLDQARDAALDNIAVVLNALCRVTGARFDDVDVLRAFDATPGLKERDGRYYGTHRATVSSRELDEAFARTAERFMAMHDDEVSQSVMRWYRLGRRAESTEEQFTYLWFAVEIAAGALKETGKIAHPCPKCGSDLYCSTCGEAPMRRRFETEAIKDLICSVAPANADHDELYTVLTKIRNTLQHGRRFHTIADTLPCTEDQAVTVLANIAWRAITRLANEDLDPAPDEPLTLARIEGVPNKVMVLSSLITAGFDKGDADNPKISDAPDVNISLVIDDRQFTFDGQEIKEEGY